MVVTLNSTATAIGEQIDGRTSIEDILESLQTTYLVAPDLLEEHLISLFSRLRELDYIESGDPTEIDMSAPSA